MLLTVKDLYDVGDSVSNFDHEYPLSVNISVGNQQSDDVDNVHESSPTFSRQPQDVTNHIVTLSICGYIDVGDGCWRPNVLVTSLRCW